MCGVSIYRFLLRLLFPAIAISTAAVALRDGSFRYLRQRLGRFTGSGLNKPLWVHCASVGETSAALAFVRAWLKRHPEDTFVLTTNTTAAAGLPAIQSSDVSQHIQHYYLPLDYPSFCRCFLNAVKPRCALIMETEIWLNLFSLCRESNVPVFIINARLSEKTLSAAKIISSYYRQSLSLVKRILARSDKDASAFITLGSEAEKVETVGNLKFAAGAAGEDPGTLPDLIGTRYVLAASTHADEEIQIAQVWRKAMHAATSDEAADRTLLVIAPRHPYRGKAVEKQLRRRGFGTRLRSRGQKPEKQESVYIADTVGELPALIAHAALVFMGGSLVPTGGHNVLEPARLGTPQVTGPYTHNFREEVQVLKKAHGLMEVSDVHGLEKIFRETLRTASPYADIAEKALASMDAYENIAAAYVARIEAAGLKETPADIP